MAIFFGCDIYVDVIRSTWPTLVALVAVAVAVATVAVTTPAVCLHLAIMRSWLKICRRRWLPATRRLPAGWRFQPGLYVNSIFSKLPFLIVGSADGGGYGGSGYGGGAQGGYGGGCE